MAGFFHLDSWRLLVDEGLDSCLNLSIEEAVARMVGKGASPSTLRLWTSLPGIAIGLSQSVDEEVNLDYCGAISAKVVRRFTGGGAVFLDEGNLNFAVSVRNDKNCPFPKDILKSYEILAGGVIEGLKAMGIDAHYFRDEIQSRGLKISGLAGANEFGSIFRHGTLLVSTNSSLVYNSLKRIKRQVTNLALLAQLTQVSTREVIDCVVSGFRKRFNVEIVAGHLTEGERELASALYNQKYTRKEWNFEGELPQSFTWEQEDLLASPLPRANP